MVSTPFTTMEPERRPTSPMIDLRVEVRPAPLRPRSVTTSPSRTPKLIPCSTCDSPYQAFSPATRRISSAMRARLGRAHVRLDDLGVPRDFRVRPLGEHGAARHHRDRVADAGDDAHVVLDHEDRAPRGGFLDERLHVAHVLVPHAG